MYIYIYIDIYIHRYIYIYIYIYLLRGTCLRRDPYLPKKKNHVILIVENLGFSDFTVILNFQNLGFAHFGFAHFGFRTSP